MLQETWEKDNGGNLPVLAWLNDTLVEPAVLRARVYVSLPVSENILRTRERLLKPGAREVAIALLGDMWRLAYREAMEASVSHVPTIAVHCHKQDG